MMTEKQILDRINEILADERFSYKTATVYKTAPLALIQCVELHTLQKVLGIEFTSIKTSRGKK